MAKGPKRSIPVEWKGKALSGEGLRAKGRSAIWGLKGSYRMRRQGMYCLMILFRCLRDRRIQKSCCRMLRLCSIPQWALLSCICCIKSCFRWLSPFGITGCRLDKSCGASLRRPLARTNPKSSIKGQKGWSRLRAGIGVFFVRHWISLGKSCRWDCLMMKAKPFARCCSESELQFFLLRFSTKRRT